MVDLIALILSFGGLHIAAKKIKDMLNYVESESSEELENQMARARFSSLRAI